MWDISDIIAIDIHLNIFLKIFDKECYKGIVYIYINNLEKIMMWNFPDKFWVQVPLIKL